MITFVTVLLILHGLLAVALMGVVSHQAIAVLFPGRSTGGFVPAYRAVSAARFTTATIVLYIITFVLGGWIYPAYRLSARIWIETARLWPISGMFEMKEQALAIGLGMLPFYWLVWRDPRDDGTRIARIATTSMLCVFVWYSFIAGHVVNNVRGLFGQ